MKIKITPENRDRIEAALEKVNGKALAHNITHFLEIEEIAKRAELELARSGLSLKKDRRGVRVTFSPRGPGKAYSKKSYRFTTTEIRLERGPNAWFLVGAERFDKFADMDECFAKTVRPEQAAIITAHAMQEYRIAAWPTRAGGTAFPPPPQYAEKDHMAQHNYDFRADPAPLTDALTKAAEVVDIEICDPADVMIYIDHRNGSWSAQIRTDGYFSPVNQISWSSIIEAADDGSEIFRESPGEIWRSGLDAVEDISRIRAGDAMHISSAYIARWNRAYESETWPKVSGDPKEAAKLAAGLQSAEMPDLDLPIDEAPAYTVTRTVSDGISSWTVTNSDSPVPGMHRYFEDWGDTSLHLDPLELAYRLLKAFD